MRLSKLKLAGFKSFVDPTTVLTPGQMVGVVGPNGCGKSNIIDAVRWVLGESRAGALRGESMMDVIFNGSTTRKPVSRASVELVFDNSEGRAAGQWSQYAEISVKRVLDRSGESSYWINNVHVRRKDVIDLFLGTGLGPRAYAIIEQGMISRIIEARPEDVRGFLEEAAGVTKYKERRRETEGRLSDARDNLARVEDIRNELGAQIDRLSGQAEVARRYKALNESLREQQILLWLLRRNEAREDAARVAAAVAETSARIEAELARLREAESLVENARDAHYQASDALHGAQADLYAANGEVTRIEGEITRLRERRQMLGSRVGQLIADETRWQAQHTSAAADRQRWENLLDAAALRCEQAQARHEELAARLPAAEDALSGAQAATRSLRHELGSAEQQLRVEETHRASALRALDTLAQRRMRVDGERHGLQAPDLEALARAEAAAEIAAHRLAALQESLDEGAAALPHQLAAVRAAQDTERQVSRSLTEARARREALARIQQKAAAPGAMGDWIQRHQIDAARPLWRELRVETGWEAALEAALRERFGAFPVQSPEGIAAALGEQPPTSIALAWNGDAPSAPADMQGLPGLPLLNLVRVENPAWVAPVAAWLSQVRAVEDCREWLSQAPQLPAQVRLVDRAGRELSRFGCSWLRADAGAHGALEREREIEELDARIEGLALEAEQGHAALAEAESASQRAQEALTNLRREHQIAQQTSHREQLAAVQLGQARQRFDERADQLRRDLEELDALVELERSHLQRAIEAQGVQDERAEQLRERLEAAEAVASEQDAAVRALRMQEQQFAREVQEALFSERECRSKLDDLARQIAQAEEQIDRCARERDAAEAEQAGLDETPMADALQEALANRELREARLSACREALDAAASRLRELDEARLRAELALRPLNESLADARLKQQAAELGQQQYDERLAEIEVDEAEFAARLAAGPKDQTLVREINRLTRELAELGPVNLAAVEELLASEERKGYLDAQSADLSEAIGTLEDAIRRIDRETREQLEETYNTVNRHFGELFPQLFGGGEAQLILTGDEILDAGVQIVARPPGKKNSSIHLLSGGEKALTAIALVFSFFQLNPAPFCLLDEVDAPLDDANTERFCAMVKRMSAITQFMFISHSKITMEMARQLVGVTMQEQGVSRVVEVDIEEALRLADPVAA
ncbi:chromosome segregation protein SMC [Niveibacterium umoris]|uniref:Chromosome partition protein Smc n=1 Tax=Niveibacterium umoris TaxID=1193620 RepID=A0A840BH36_9RHOO|nr:chromosome segregation protein [Niveibacterium umoris]